MEEEQRRLKLLDDLQKYVPFLRAMIANLQNSSKTQEKQRSPQLSKMMSLLSLLTDQKRKLKAHTLEKCEDVLRKLYDKMELSASVKKRNYPKIAMLDSNIKDGTDNPIHSPLNIILDRLNASNSSAPASPSPPLFDSNLNIPIIIPTERVCEESSNSPQRVKPLAQDNKNTYSASVDNSDVLFMRRPATSCKSNSRGNDDSQHVLPKSPSRTINTSPSQFSPKKIDLYRSDNTDSYIQQTNISKCSPTAEKRRITVFDRLGEKLVHTESPLVNNSKKTPLKCSNDKVPKSATLITNLTKQLKEAQLQQEIESDIANYLTQNEENDFIKNTNTLTGKISKPNQSVVMPKKQESSCGIKKSTPVLKATTRKLEDSSVFGDVLAKLDKTLIDNVSKNPKHKTTEFKDSKEDKSILEQKELDKKLTGSGHLIQPRHDEMQLPQLDNNEIKKQTITRSFEECSKTVSNKDNSLSSRNVFDDLSKKEQSSSTFSHENKMTKKPVENYERLSDKYPRKRISDSGNAEYMQKHTSSHLLPSNKSAVKNADFEQKKILSSKLDPNPFGKIIHSTEENSKLINIPDIKPNDPRIKTVSSPRSEPLPLVTNYDMPNTKNSTFSESRSRYTFPSILDMDYRYVPNQNFVHSQAVQPQTFTTNPKSNFMPRHNNQNFHQKTPLLPTPNSNIRNSKDFTNSEKCYVSASHEYQNTDYFYDNADQRISKNDYYDHQFDYRDRVQFDLNEHSSLKYNKHEFMHSNSRFHDNSRSHYRGNSAYGRDNKYRWSRSLSKMSDPRTFCTDDSNCHVENDIDYRSPRENTSSALNLNKSSSFLEESITQNSSKVTDVKRPSPKESKCISNSRFKHNDKIQNKSPPRKNLHDPNTNTKDAIKSFKIPKIKRDPDQQSNNPTTNVNSLDINNQLKDIAKTPHDVKSTIMNNDKVDIKSQSVISDCNNVKNINTKDENVSNEEKVLLTKLLDMISGIYKDKKEKQSDTEDQLNILQKLEEKIGSKKVEKIKQIIDGDSDEDINDNKSNISESPIFKKTKKRIKKIESDSSDEDVTDSNKHTNYECNENSNEVQDIEKKVVKPKRRNALEMLQHDVRDMFICEGVLTATGRRMCRILKEDSIMETNCILNTDDLKSNSCRKNRKNLRKINYTESKDDLTLNTEEENETFKSKSSMHMQPRIILEKLKDFDCQLEIEENICRGRNVARRGRGISISARTLRNPIRNEKINTNLNKCDAENQNVIEKNGQCEDIASENTEDKNDAVDKEHNSIPEKCDNLMSDSGEKNIVKVGLNLKKKNKRKGAWKMGILRSKRKIKRTVCDNIEAASENIKNIDMENLEQSSPVSEKSIDNFPLNTDENYFVDCSEKYSCKLCTFTGKMITIHYVHNHPNNEVYSSRMNPTEAEIAKHSFCETNQGQVEDKSDSTELSYECRFCKTIILKEDTAFLFEHLSIHTGEFRYKCNVCDYRIMKTDSLKHHFKYRHKFSKVPLTPCIMYDVPNTNGTYIFGYMCKYCNFTQIFENNIKRHIRTNHPGKELSISKVNMFKISKCILNESNENSIVNRSENKSTDNVNEDVDFNDYKKIDDGPPLIVHDLVSNHEYGLKNDSNKKPSDNTAEIVSSESANILVDKNPFLLEKEAELSKVDITFSDVLINNSRPMFEPFLKKMKITDALQCKINNMNENVVDEDNEVLPQNDNAQIILDNITSDNTETSQKIISGSNLDFDKNITTETKDITSDIQPEISDKVRAINLDFSFAKSVNVADTPKSELRISDEQDSNDSEVYNSPQPFVNVDEVLNSIEKNVLTPSVMSDTIQRLASSLISSPAKSKTLYPDSAQESVINENNLHDISKEFILQEGPPPSEPISLNVVRQRSTKLQIGTIRISITMDNKKMYECFEKGCVYNSESDSLFLDHIEKCHSRSKWNGVCFICNNPVETPNEDSRDGFPLAVCLQHILKHDSEIKNEQEEIVKPKGFLKMRRLSGDKLSIIKPSSSNNVQKCKDEDSFLKIVDVVSLSTDASLSNAFSDQLSEDCAIEITKNTKITQTKFDSKPWLPDSNCIKNDFTDEMFKHTYKCMGQSCFFTSNDHTEFQNHLLLTHQHQQGNEDYLQCCYCVKKYESIISLSGHIRNHRNCVYQCRHCFYRCFCKVQINIHIESYHKYSSIPNVILLNITLPEWRKWRLSNSGDLNNVLPYICKFEDCKFKNKNKGGYARHLQTHNMTKWPCFICDDVFISISDLLVHTEIHNINSLQCCYCIFGAKDNKQILEHLAHHHSEMPATVFVRSEISNNQANLQEIQKCNLEVAELLPSVVLLNIDRNVDGVMNPTNSLITACDDDHINPCKTLDESINFDDDNLVIDESCSNDLHEISENEHTSMISNKRDEALETSMKNIGLTIESTDSIINTSNKGLVVSDTPSKSSSIDSASHHINSTSCAQTKTTVFNVAKMQNKSTISEQVIKQYAIKENNIANIDLNVVKHLGIENCKLFRCSKCDVSFESSLSFKQHLIGCMKNGYLLSCSICMRSFKNIGPYVDHLKIHGIHRYSCEFCPYRTARSTEIKLHVINKHKETAVYMVPLDPLKTNPDRDFFKCTNKPPNELSNVTNYAPTKSNSYTPSDIDKLPRNSIYFKDVECALCPFKTKVRTNIIRHLQQHKSDNSVPEVCPVNPVPCLVTNEKYFDKMKNLACSSHVEKAESGNMSNIIKNENELPKFVIEPKRYVCGIIGCTYLTVNEDMLRHHYLALHAEETCYMCPHCPNNLEKFTGTINIDKIISHLKLHDTRLYKCPYCNYHKSQKHIIERHVADKHPNSVNQVIVIREDSNLNVKMPKKEIRSKTWMCGLCDYTAYDKTEIVKHTWEEHGMKSQYKCALCQYRCSYKNSFTNHFAARHINHPVEIVSVYKKIETNANEKQMPPDEQATNVDTTPLWLKSSTGLRHIRGILLEEENLDKNVESSQSIKTPIKRKRSITPNYSETLTIGKSVESVPQKEHKLKLTVDSQLFENTKIHSDRKRINSINKDDDTNRIIESVVSVAKKPKLIPCYDLTDTTNNPTSVSTIKPKNVPSLKIKNNSTPTDVIDDVICLSSDEDEEPDNFLSDLPPLLDEARYGEPLNDKYHCSFCEEFVTSEEHEMFGHLCNELQYVRYSCKFCNYVSWDVDQLVSQCKKTHPNAKPSIEELKKNEEMENWISKAIQHQTNLILKISSKGIENIETETRAIGETKANNEQIFTCDSCSYTTRFFGYFERHQKSHSLKMYSCGHCAMSASRKQVEDHIKISHPDKEIVLLNCSVDESNDDLQNLSADPDIKNSTSEKYIYVCYYCPKRGNSIDDIEKHWEVTHKNPKVNSEGKVTKHALQFQYKIVSEDQFLKRNKYFCEHCGKQGYFKALQQHHKAKHPKLSEILVPLKDKPPFKCHLCNVFVCNETIMRHFNQVHSGQVTSSKVVFNDNKSSKSVKIYKCNYCSSTFDNISDITQHHDNLHSHKNFVLNTSDSNVINDTKIMRRMFKCPLCTNSFEAYNDACQHIETHIKPFSCNYCLDGFSFPDTVKLHITRVHSNSDISNYSAVPNIKEKIQEAINRIDVIYKKCDNVFDNDSFFANECKKMKLLGNEVHREKDSLYTSPNSITTFDLPTSSTESQKGSRSLIRTVAKKSTTKLSCKVPMAKKSTSKQRIRNEEMFQSHYKKSTNYNNSGIHTVISLGGKPMRLSIENLQAITNIHPTLKIIDIKSQLKDEKFLTILR